MNGYTPNQFGGQTPSDIKPGKKISKKMLAIIGGAAAVVIIALVLILTLGGSGVRNMDDITDKMVAAYEDDDWEAVYDLYYDKYLDAMKDEFDYTEKELKDEFKDVFEDDMDDLKDDLGDIKKITVTDVDKDTYSKSDVKDANESFKDECDVDLKIDEMVDVRIEVEVEGEDDDMDDGIIKYTAVKVGSRWYIVDHENLY